MILTIVLLSSIVLGVGVNSFWVVTSQDRHNNKWVVPINSILIITLFGSLLLLGLGG